MSDQAADDDMNPAGDVIVADTWGGMPDGAAVKRYTVTGAGGLRIRITEFAATLTAVEVPVIGSEPVGVLLGYDMLDPYVELGFGQTIGRYANRIAGGRFVLDGVEYRLPINQPPNTLHGGPAGFGHKLWRSAASRTPEGPSVMFTYLSPNGEEGFPGRLSAQVVYTVTEDNVLRIDYTAVTDMPTVINLTNHAYWNLDGATSGSVLDERLTIDADAYTPTDDTLIPTGEIAPLDGTPLDFRTPTALGARLGSAEASPYRIEHGYDHNYVLRGYRPGQLAHAARLEAVRTGIVMDVETTEPGLQLYTGNFLHSGRFVGPDGRPFAPHDAVALECEAFPDSPNHPNFPSTVLRPGEIYRQTTVYRFSSNP